MTNATLKIYPNTDKISKKDGTIPIYLRVMVNGVKAEAKIKDIKLSENQLSQWNPLIGCLNDSKSPVNITLDLIKTNFNRLILKNQFEDYSLNATFIRDYLAEKKPLQTTNNILNYVQNFYTNVVVPSSRWSKSTKKIFNKSVNHFCYFLNHYQLNSLSFSEIKRSHGKLFAEYLTSTINDVIIKGEKVVKQSISSDSASQVVKKLRHIFSVAEDEEKIQINPFNKIKFPKTHKSSKNLNIYEIKKLYDADLTHRPNLELCRDLFLFQVFSGMAYVDMVNLKPHQIINITPEKLSYTYIRTKTKIEAKVIVNKYLNELITKFKTHPYTKIQGHVVPIINLCEINSRLKILADMFNLSLPDLSSHIGRHSFRQFIDEAEIEHAWTIHKMMGWSYENNINNTYANGNDKLLLSASSRLENYFDEHLQSKTIENTQLDVEV